MSFAPLIIPSQNPFIPLPGRVAYSIGSTYPAVAIVTAFQPV
jgi:hypothetical protein